MSLIACAPAASLAGPLDVPIYNSLAGNVPQLYLDFDGDTTDTWGYGDTQFHPGTTPAYDVDGDPTSFSQQELDNIFHIWSGVAEKYSPFNLNVTTKDPGNLDDYKTVRIVIGGDGSWAPAGSGGIAALKGFMLAQPNTGFVFPGHLSNGNPRYVAESAAHEAGHEFGLQHQSTFDAAGAKTAEYNTGDASRAPIMGTSYYTTLGQWWNGPSTVAYNVPQDDLFLLTVPLPSLARLGYRADDHGNSIATAVGMQTLTASAFHAAGIIEQNTDSDFFSFPWPGGQAHIEADPNADAPMLDLTLRLFDVNGNLLASSLSSLLAEQIDTNLNAGTYYASIASAGGYGDIGQYTLDVTVPEPASAAGMLLLIGSLIPRRRFSRAVGSRNLL